MLARIGISILLFTSACLASPNGRPRSSSEIQQAQRELMLAIAEVRRHFLESGELREARAAVASASADYRIARDAALASLRTSQPYKSARIDIERLERQMERARSGRRSIATVILEKRAAISRLEMDALKSSDDFQTARYGLMDANIHLAGLWRDFQQHLKTDARCEAARERIAAARRAR
jgi:hypothetical protein